ncbi:protein phosphatase methylesterase 1 isoform X2 [Lycorma delicatula]|uniref:protein phosphatase methylesterase 1 isoform X2 n=1 Tax=Lycorma delicatula TaxID=130591 RepID=UPI003F511AE0
MSAFQKALFTSKLPPRSVLQANGNTAMNRGRVRGGKQDFTPVTWDKYFSERSDVKVGENSFRVYRLGSSGPLLVLLHGGGFSALTWAVFSKTIVELVECQVLAIDLRGHGDTSTADDSDLSIQTMMSDVVSVVQALFPMAPPIVLMGHSMGGAIAVHVAHSDQLSTVIGLVVIDVVEGTALGALASMQSFLRGRPQSFLSLEDAIRWSLQSGQLKNTESAKVSMPGQIKNGRTGKTGVQELDVSLQEDVADGVALPPRTLDRKNKSEEAIEEEEEGESDFKVPPLERRKQSSGDYTWRIDLRLTEQFWPGWFQGLSKMFLSAHAQKLLLLANLDRLDTDLTVGQMQGKFEIHAFETTHGRVGHVVHEDVPDNVCQVLATFLTRNKFAEAKTDFIGSMPCC